MPKTCKIELLGLSETVQQLMAEGVVTRAEMTEKLQNDYGADVSEATVGRYMARIRSAAQNEAFSKIQDHVNKVVPDDLEALEEMEKKALEWTREAGATAAERSAAAAEQITGELEKWRSMLLEEKEPKKLVRWIVKQCSFYLAEDDRRQEQRLSAMRMVHKIIETKLSKAGLLDDDARGRIVFLQKQAMDEGESGGSESEAGKKDKRVLRLVKDDDR